MFFCAALTFLPSTHYVCLFSVGFSCLVLSICVCVCVFFLSPSHSDLDCPVAWGSSGLLLFSCSLRYLFHTLTPSAFKLSPMCFHFVVLDPKLGDSRFETNTRAYMFRHSLQIAHTRTRSRAHTYAFRDNIITGCMHLGTPTVDPCAH